MISGLEMYAKICDRQTIVIFVTTDCNESAPTLEMIFYMM